MLDLNIGKWTQGSGAFPVIAMALSLLFAFADVFDPETLAWEPVYILLDEDLRMLYAPLYGTVVFALLPFPQRISKWLGYFAILVSGLYTLLLLATASMPVHDFLPSIAILFLLSTCPALLLHKSFVWGWWKARPS